MERMVIKYNRKIVRRSALLGLAFILVGIASQLFGTMNLHFFTAMGAFHVITAIYNYRYPYVTMDGNQLKVGWRKLEMEQVRQIKYFAGDLKIYAGKREVTISREMVDRASMEDFDRLHIFLDQKISGNALIT